MMGFEIVTKLRLAYHDHVFFQAIESWNWIRYECFVA